MTGAKNGRPSVKVSAMTTGYPSPTVMGSSLIAAAHTPGAAASLHLCTLCLNSSADMTPISSEGNGDEEKGAEESPERRRVRGGIRGWAVRGSC